MLTLVVKCSIRNTGQCKRKSNVIFPIPCLPFVSLEVYKNYAGYILAYNNKFYLINECHFSKIYFQTG